MHTRRHLGRGTAVLAAFALMLSAVEAQAETRDGADERFDEVERMTPRQLSDRAEGYVDEMRAMLDQVLRMLDDARAEKDVVKLNCVNEKLTHLRGLVRVSEQGQITMQEAIARQEMDEARHEFTKLVVAHDRVRQLRAEAEECVGQLAFVVDEELEIEVEIPPDLPDVVPDIIPVPPVAARPPRASPSD